MPSCQYYYRANGTRVSRRTGEVVHDSGLRRQKKSAFAESESGQLSLLGEPVSGANGTARVGETYAKDNGKNQVEFKILDKNANGYYIEVTKSTFDGTSRYSAGNKTPVSNTFFSEQTTKRTGTSSAARNNKKISTYLGNEYKDAYKEIPKLPDGTKVRTTYRNGGTTTYTLSSKNGKKMIKADDSKYRAVQADTVSKVSNRLGKPVKVEFIRGRT